MKPMNASRLLVTVMMVWFHGAFVGMDYLSHLLTEKDAVELGPIALFFYQLNIGILQHAVVLVVVVALFCLIWLGKSPTEKKDPSPALVT